MDSDLVGLSMKMFIKENLYDKLSLKVYKKNEGAISFYQAMDFETILGQVDEKTNELEYVMEWNKK